VNIEPTLEHLLKRPDPFICLVKGEWGVGKTHFIKKFIRDHHASIAKQSYSYVSLFGIANAGDLMHAIYLNTVPTKTLGSSLADAFSRSSSDEAIDRVKLFLGRAKPLLSRLADIPVFGANNIKAFVVNNAAHWFTRNALIVIDDLERHSSSLSIRDILGILTDLKEERGCQIIIVMNEDALQKDNGDKSYFETKEKVIDREIVFQPTVEDAIAIGFTDKEKNRTAVECCQKLQIGNIRTIQKIDSTLRQLRELLTDLGVTVPETFDLQLQSTAVLATWAYWERVIDIDDLENLELGDSTLVRQL
jgi:Cdc6-like AAA superfamily ATPase